MNKVPKFLKKLHTWLIFATLVFGTYAGAAAIGLQIPRWTWYSEHLELAGEVRGNKVDLHQGQIDSIDRRLTTAIIARSKAKPGTDLHDILTGRKRKLERQLKAAEAKLKKVRGF